MVKQGRAAAFWLVLVILSIMLSPRIQVGDAGGESIEIRVQDLLLVPIMLYLASTMTRHYALSRLWSWVLPAFIWSSFIVVVVSVIVYPHVPIVRRIAFYGRGLELLVLALVVAGLYLRAGPNRFKLVVRAFIVAAIVNFGWVLYQLATGQKRTFLGDQEAIAGVVAYGPQLFGEPSAFGTGQFFAFTAAVGVAALRTGVTHRVTAIALLAAGAAGTFLAESRASLIAVGVAIVIALVFSGRAKRVNLFGVFYVIVIGVIAFILILPQLAGRLSPEALMRAFGVRNNIIWEPLLELLIEQPLVGVGPGALIRPLPIEGHNVILRAWLDYGFVAGSLFIALFLIVIARSFRLSHDRGLDPQMRFFSNLAFVFIVNIFVAGVFQDSLTAVTSSHLAMLTVGLFAAVYLEWTDSRPSPIEQFRMERLRM